LFDELHFIDQPSFSFRGQGGFTGTISPYRLSFAIFDELIPSERLEKLTIEDVIRYRKASEKEREAFLEHLAVLQAKQAAIGLEGDYAGAIDKVVTTEILPAADL
jgi:hypothetical protein